MTSGSTDNRELIERGRNHDVMDPEALERWRLSASDGGGHDRAGLNNNSLRRLVALVDQQADALEAAEQEIADIREHMRRMNAEGNSGRYWEARYRDEAAALASERAKLVIAVEALTEIERGLVMSVAADTARAALAEIRGMG